LATEVSPFEGPSPSKGDKGSHRFALWLFQQPTGMINFEELSPSIEQWDYEAFIEKHSLGKPVASNWHVTQYATARETNGNTWIDSKPDAIVYDPSRESAVDISLNCSATPLNVEYAIKFYSGTATCGNLFLEEDVEAEGVDAPRVSYELANEEEYYTLILLDIEAGMAGSWPQVTIPSIDAPVRHWTAGNIPGIDLKSGDFSRAMTVSSWKTGYYEHAYGSHRYAVLLFSQGSKMIDYVKFDDDDLDRLRWDYESFIADHNLGAAVASNWYVKQRMESRYPSVEVVV